MSGRRIAAAARAMLGTRFRGQGRGPGGVDCVGVVLIALAAAGVRTEAPDDYDWRSDDGERVARWMAAAGLRPCDGEAVGDVLLLRAGAGQVHLAVRSVDGIVHADAGARRVVERPGAAPWPLIAAWRLGEE